MPFEPRKLGKEIARADKAGARAVVIIGQRGWTNGTVTIRNLATGAQEDVETASVVDSVQRLLLPGADAIRRQ